MVKNNSLGRHELTKPKAIVLLLSGALLAASCAGLCGCSDGSSSSSRSSSSSSSSDSSYYINDAGVGTFKNSDGSVTISDGYGHGITIPNY